MARPLGALTRGGQPPPLMPLPPAVPPRRRPSGGRRQGSRRFGMPLGRPVPLAAADPRTVARNFSALAPAGRLRCQSLTATPGRRCGFGGGRALQGSGSTCAGTSPQNSTARSGTAPPARPAACRTAAPPRSTCPAPAPLSRRSRESMVPRPGLPHSDSAVTNPCIIFSECNAGRGGRGRRERWRPPVPGYEREVRRRVRPHRACSRAHSAWAGMGGKPLQFAAETRP